MKMKQLVTTAAFLVAIALASPSAYAITSSQKAAVKKAVTSVPLPEMPAKAAELVKQASKEDRQAIAVLATQVAIYKSRAAAAPVVAAIVKAAPDLAAAVSMAAAELEGSQAVLIARAATEAAPQSKREIATAINNGISSGRAQDLASVTTSTEGQSPSNSRRGGRTREGAEGFITVPVSQIDLPISQIGAQNPKSYLQLISDGQGGYSVRVPVTDAGTPIAFPYERP